MSTERVAKVPLTCDNDTKDPRECVNTPGAWPDWLESNVTNATPDRTPPTERDIARFWSKVDKTGGCWIWNGCCHEGYGQFDINRKQWRAHHVPWFLRYGSLPDGHVMVFDHLCRVRECVNPDHLEVVTRTENVARGIGPSALNSAKTECPQGHAYTAENIVGTKSRKRRCRICHVEQNRRYRAKQQSLTVVRGTA